MNRLILYLEAALTGWDFGRWLWLPVLCLALAGCAQPQAGEPIYIGAQIKAACERVREANPRYGHATVNLAEVLREYKGVKDGWSQAKFQKRYLNKRVRGRGFVLDAVIDGDGPRALLIGETPDTDLFHAISAYSNDEEFILSHEEGDEIEFTGTLWIVMRSGLIFDKCQEVRAEAEQ